MNDGYSDTKKGFTFEELLRFYQDSGVDISLYEHPINRLLGEQADNRNKHEISSKPQHLQQNDSNVTVSRNEDRQAPQKTSNHLHAKKLTNISYVPLDDQIKRAQAIALSANSLEELLHSLNTYDGNPLKSTAKNTCFADGKANSPLMVISDVPEREEDLRGLPFVGQPGELLNKMLAAIGYNREDVYIANVLYWRPPGNREPTAHEIELSRPFINRQIELANPSVILACGGAATTWLTGTNDSILRLRGNWQDFTTQNGTKIKLMPTLHPRYLLRNPAHKKFAWQDLLNVKVKLRELNH